MLHCPTLRPLISIVLPTYNGSRFIEQAIESCLDQSYPHWELIIVDDASTDDTPIRVARYVQKDPRLRIIRHHKNLRLPKALNTGFSRANGEYLTWTSDDNYYHPKALEHMVEYLENHTEIAMVYTDYTVVDEKNNEVRRAGVRPLLWLSRGNYVGPSFLYRRKVHEAVGGYSNRFLLAEDYEFWLRLSITFEAAPLHQNLYYYRTHSGSLTFLYGTGPARPATAAALSHHLPRLPWFKNSTRTRLFFRLAESFRYWGDTKHMIQCCAHAGFYSPYLLIRLIKKRLTRKFSKQSTFLRDLNKKFLGRFNESIRVGKGGIIGKLQH